MSTITGAQCRPIFPYACALYTNFLAICRGNHKVSSSIWNQFAGERFSKAAVNCSSRFGECNFSLNEKNRVNDIDMKICAMEVPEDLS